MMMKKIVTPVLAVAMLAGSMAVSVQPAEAGRGGRVAAGVAAAIIGLGVLGAYAHSRERRYVQTCYKGPERCSWVGRSCWYDRWGQKVCSRGHYECYRPTICD